MKEILIGCGENLKGKIYQTVPLVCQKVFETQTLKLVEAFAFGGSFARGIWKPGQDIDTDVCLTRLPENGRQQQICKKIVEVFNEADLGLDIRFITDRMGNHGIFVEHKPTGPNNPLELPVDFNRNNLIDLYQKEHPESIFIAKNEAAAKFWFGVIPDRK